MTLAAKASLSYGNNLRYLENQERSDRLRRRVEQLNQIFELGQMLQSNVDTGTILEAIAFSVQQSIGFDVVMLMMVDEEAGLLRRVAQAGLPIDAFEDSKKNILPIKTLQELFENETVPHQRVVFPALPAGFAVVRRRAGSDQHRAGGHAHDAPAVRKMTGTTAIC